VLEDGGAHLAVVPDEPFIQRRGVEGGGRRGRRGRDGGDIFGAVRGREVRGEDGEPAPVHLGRSWHLVGLG
jgi:hypothetical protein